MYVHFAWEGRPRNDLYCVGRDVKPYSLTLLAFAVHSYLSQSVSSYSHALYKWLIWTDFCYDN